MADQALYTGEDGISAYQTGKAFSITKQFSFATNNVSSADVCQLFKLPAGTYLLGVRCEVDTAEGATATATIGDGSDVDGWVASVDLNSAATDVVTGESTEVYAGGKMYKAEDTIDFIPGANLDAAVVTVTIFGINCT